MQAIMVQMADKISIGQSVTNFRGISRSLRSSLGEKFRRRQSKSSESTENPKNNESLHLKIKAKIENWRPRPFAVPWLMVLLHVSPI